MPHTIKAGKAELTISSKRYGRHAWRMRSWSPERRSQAHVAAEKRLQHKHPRKRDAAIFAASEVVGTLVMALSARNSPPANTGSVVGLDGQNQHVAGPVSVVRFLA
jgi:hypothetical protein